MKKERTNGAINCEEEEGDRNPEAAAGREEGDRCAQTPRGCEEAGRDSEAGSRWKEGRKGDWKEGGKGGDAKGCSEEADGQAPGSANARCVAGSGTSATR